MSFGKPVNDRTLADINRANAEFHGGGTKDAETTGSQIMKPLSQKRKESRENSQRQQAAWHKERGEVFARHAAGGRNAPTKKAQDLSHEGNKQVIRKKGVVVVQHDEEDSGPLTRAERKEKVPGKLSQRINSSLRKGLASNIARIHSKHGSAAASKEHKELKKFDKPGVQPNTHDEQDSFPATDKTLADVNDANKAYYDEEDSSHLQRVQRKESNPNKFSQNSETGQRKLAANFIKGGNRAQKKEAKSQLLSSNRGRQLRGEDARDAQDVEGIPAATQPIAKKIGKRALKMAKRLSKDDRDSFPATDKTLADVNDANRAFYAGDAEKPKIAESEPKVKNKAAAARANMWGLIAQKSSSEGANPETVGNYAKAAAHHGKKALGQDLSHEGNKQVIRKKGVVVVQHDEEDSSPMQRIQRKERNKGKVSQHSEERHQIKYDLRLAHQGNARRGHVAQKEQARKSRGDSFPATDKTLADVNDANKAYYENSPHAGNAQDSKARDAVPSLGNWSMHAGGTSAAEGKHGYTHSVSHGESNTNLHTQYSISPVSSSTGKHQGYQVGAWSPKAGHTHKTLGTVSHPNQGVKLAQKHYNEHFNS